jgi:hypothetical protein
MAISVELWRSIRRWCSASSSTAEIRRPLSVRSISVAEENAVSAGGIVLAFR